ncbi:MAG: hypothetical protein Q7S86_04725 [bacterium]|nr:hypothetical protein [bacterium]
MSKKTAYIIIVAFIVIVAGGLLAFYFYTNRGTGGNILPVDGEGNIFPADSSVDGGGGEPVVPPEISPITPSGSGTETSRVDLKELSKRPSAGAVALPDSGGRGVLVRFVEKGTGNVYEVGPDSSEETRLSNTTIPKIAEVIWNKDGTRLVARYLKDGENETIQSYYAALVTSAEGQATGELSGSFLTENIKTLSTNPDRNKLFYIVNHSEGASGVTADFDGGKKTQIFDSPLREWLVDWPSSETVVLTTKPSASIPGFMFLLNTKNGALTRTISGIRGLTTLVNPDASLVLYSENTTAGLSLKTYSFKKSVSEVMSVTTLPEKCVWSKIDSTNIYCSVPTYLGEGTYPDGWYQGVTSFSDDIWKIDASSGVASIVAEPKKLSGRDIDGTNLLLSQKEDYLFFTNKFDSRIWSLRLQN